MKVRPPGLHKTMAKSVAVKVIKRSELFLRVLFAFVLRQRRFFLVSLYIVSVSICDTSYVIFSILIQKGNTSLLVLEPSFARKNSGS
jgi:hypothetical protein